MNRRRALLAASMPSGGGVTFPITLAEGDNGQVGIDLYNYFMQKGKQIEDAVGWFTYIPSENETIYILDSTVSTVLYQGYDELIFTLTPNISSIMGLYLYPNGSLYIHWD